MAWILTPALDSLRNAFNTRFPTRDKASDGTKGDPAHAATKSGHNPDESGNSEYTDADNIDEVRALDVDADLHSDVTMWDVIQRILVTPADLARLKYIIHRQTIWTRNNNWQPAAYHGDNQHMEHAHFSGDPATDNNNAPWQSVLTTGTIGRKTDMYVLALSKETGDAVYGGDGSFHRHIQTMAHAKALENAGATWAKFDTKANMLESIGPKPLSEIGQVILSEGQFTTLLSKLEETSFAGAQRAERE